jgi:hypothetical protein
MIRIGLWLYDHIGGKQSLPKSQGYRCAIRAGAMGSSPA